ncbi:MAG: hypothetical protein JWP69_856 [Flaviaesturariibacter sp.]|nr:hypothetical protein [Flaviaesturariibacter sp.]
MLNSLLRDRKLVALVVLAIVIKLFSVNEQWVEEYYTYGFYPHLSKALRFLFGWIPFSIGDILYIVAAIYLVLKAWKLLRLLARRKVKEYLSWILFRKFLKLVISIYIVFNLFWGLNYNRLGIAYQLGLEVKPYSQNDLFQVTQLLQQRLNFYAAKEDTMKRLELNRLPLLKTEGVKNYKKAANSFPFLSYERPSVKTSVFSPIAHYFGFTGYFNPFTSEAQMNSEEPVFLKPFVVNHEMAHQLGYGKENEASFVAYLACKASDNANFRYSVYYELYYNALFECRMTGDTTMQRALSKSLHPRVRRDKRQEIQYRLGKKNKVSPFVTDFYDGYLKLNNQPKGMATYNEVIAWLIAYVKKNGAAAI